MSAPLLALLFPLGAAALLILIRNYRRLTGGLGTALALLFAWLAWQVPIGIPLALGPWSLKLGDVFTLFGRRFVLLDHQRPVLVLLYLFAALWFVSGSILPISRLFVPLGFGILALLTATIAVNPFLYAALFLEMAILLSVPMLVLPGKEPGSGILRFLTFQTLGVPFILFTGWMLSGVEASPGELSLVVRAAILLGFGFAFLLAIFPFHTWVPMLFEQVDPSVSAFLLFMLPGGIMLFGIGFLDRFAWLRSSPDLPALLQYVGLLMVASGGIWAAFQTDLGRLLGYATLLETGYALLALSLFIGPAGLSHFFALLLVRGLATLIWAFVLSWIRGIFPDLNFRTVQGFGRQAPLAVAALVAAHLSLVGFPLLPGFTMRLGLWQDLASQAPLAAMISLGASLGLLVAGFRTLAVLMMEREPVTAPFSLPRAQQMIFALSLGVLFLLGLFPQWYMPFVSPLLDVFGSLATR